MAARPAKVLILGIGNLLWADEGFGVRCAEALREQYRFDERVRIMDGGTQGLYLLPYVQQAEVLVIFDAVDFALPPGSLHRIEDEQVPAYMGARKMSLHQTGFQEVLASAALLGQAPEKVLLVGVQPVEIEDYGGSLTEPVRARISEAIDVALQYLHDLGVTPVAIDAAAGESDPLQLQAYEAGRPAAERACRHGDERFIGLRLSLDAGPQSNTGGTP